MYSIECRRSACHTFKLLLKDKLRSNKTDNIISAKIPNPSNDKQLNDIIVKSMIHDPYGPDSAHSLCMKDGKCSKEFPRKLKKEALHNETDISSPEKDPQQKETNYNY
ncbi:hypothetical protein AVEN_46469-1 [Araneus ventricosus]|uniref:Uncharacterized protein n=1 Tax=Araneus ventricosus TaxID=182803 RepID=A0A4Y2WUX5_ARAVE|nr:hypothetical protein AVEN_46469-1 [Araneus ventricosus]